MVPRKSKGLRQRISFEESPLAAPFARIDGVVLGMDSSGLDAGVAAFDSACGLFASCRRKSS